MIKILIGEKSIFFFFWCENVWRREENEKNFTSINFFQSTVHLYLHRNRSKLLKFWIFSFIHSFKKIKKKKEHRNQKIKIINFFSLFSNSIRFDSSIDESNFGFKSNDSVTFNSVFLVNRKTFIVCF